MDTLLVLENIFESNKISDLNELFDKVKTITCKTISSDVITSNLVDSRFFDDVRNLKDKSNLNIFIGNNLKKIKLDVTDEENREHNVLLEYQNANKIKVIETSLPYSSFQDLEYRSLEQLYEVFTKYVKELQNYLNELDELSKNCNIVDPVRPTYRDVYRKIIVGKGMWLHIEVTRKGEATNVHLIGGDDLQRERLDKGLLKWDHDLMIYRNIMNIFDLDLFPDTQPSSVSSCDKRAPRPECAICLCFELADSAPPAPLCTNSRCGLYFHRSCLYQWLVMCAHKQPHQFAARGSCPNCGAVVSVEPHD